MSKDFRYNKKEWDSSFEEPLFKTSSADLLEKNNDLMKQAKKAQVLQAKQRRENFEDLH